jgi:large subunit ribosomal protein L29
MAEEVKNKEVDEKTLSREKELKADLRKARFDHALGQLDDTSKISKLKKDIARVKTKTHSVKKDNS